MNIHGKNEGQECKTGPTKGGALVGGKGRVERAKEDEYDLCTFIYFYENRTMKSVKIILSRVQGEWWECKHIQKYHN
jgi:hypothetical protein